MRAILGNARYTTVKKGYKFIITVKLNGTVSILLVPVLVRY